MSGQESIDIMHVRAWPHVFAFRKSVGLGVSGIF